MISSSSLASTIDIQCVGPVGGVVAKVEGELRLTKTSDGQMQAEGLVKVNGASPVAVLGGYDEIDGFKYATLGAIATGSPFSVIYVDFKDSENRANSYIEIESKMYPLNCGAQR